MEKCDDPSGGPPDREDSIVRTEDTKRAVLFSSNCFMWVSISNLEPFVSNTL